MGMPVSYGCSVMVSPGASGPPDYGTITVITGTTPTASGQPFATVGSTCMMINTLTGVPYTVSIGQTTSLVTGSNQALVRMGDSIQAGSGMMTIIGPPAATNVNDSSG